jgi:hypothetical protein
MPRVGLQPIPGCVSLPHSMVAPKDSTTTYGGIVSKLFRACFGCVTRRHVPAVGIYRTLLVI